MTICILFTLTFFASLIALTTPGSTYSLDRPPGSIPDTGALIRRITEAVDPEHFEESEEWEAHIEAILDQFPLDLNQAGMVELMYVPVMTERLAGAIIEYRSENTFRRVDDLLEVPGIGTITAERLRPWFTVENDTRYSHSRNLNFGVQQFFRFQRRYPTADGFKSVNGSSHYPGTPARLYHRQTLATDRLSANITQVKLPGEPFHPPHGFDFTSGHLAYEGQGSIRRVITGDYSARFGQGLVLWSTSTFGKGGTTHRAPYRRTYGIMPYRSSGQIRFFRGIAMEAALPLPSSIRSSGADWSLSVMHSRRSRSAVVISGDTIRPPGSNPYHRTDSERSRRKNTREKVRAANITMNHPNGKLGLTWSSYTLDRPVVPLANAPYGQASPHSSMGSDLDIAIGPVRVFGEFARLLSIKSTDGDSALKLSKNAWTAGILGTFTEYADWVVSFRSFGPAYRAEYADAFGEGSGAPANQSGWYAGLRLRPNNRWNVQAYLDRFHFPRPRRGFTRSSDGWEAMLHLVCRFRSGHDKQLRIRYKERSRETQGVDINGRMRLISGKESRLSGRYQWNWRAQEKVFLRSQFDGILTMTSGEQNLTGFAASQSARWQVIRTMRLDIGWSVFDTDGYPSRLYLFQHDLTHVIRSQMVYGVGRLSYLVVRFRPAAWFLAEFKYGKAYYADRPVLGSGHDRTIGPGRTELGFQLRLAY
ncbi:MAG: ComEA family DNA-binding protein [Bacteroidota bacterium]